MIQYLILLSANALAGHPTFELFDENGEKTLLSENVSVSKTCAACHDVDFIESTSSHKAAGVDVGCLDCHSSNGIEDLKSHMDEAGFVNCQMLSASSERCADCHGVVNVHSEQKVVLPSHIVFSSDGSEVDRSLKTGEIFSDQRISNSGLNIANKDSLSRSWNVHAERGLDCTSCHFSPNNPAQVGVIRKDDLEHLKRDPRAGKIHDYLERPVHDLASATCENCHDSVAAHPDMPARSLHLASLACQSCHVPELYGPAAQVIDNTVITPNGPRIEIRNLSSQEGAPSTWYLAGYKPFLADNGEKLAPYNFVTELQWVDKGQNPVGIDLVEKAWLIDGNYRQDVLKALDLDSNGKLSDDELEKSHEFIKGKLRDLGVEDPEISAFVNAFPIVHGVVEGDWVDGKCESCHTSTKENIILANSMPSDVNVVLPEVLKGQALIREGKSVFLAQANSERYILGSQLNTWSDKVGFSLFLMSSFGIFGHGAIRFATRKKRQSSHESVHKEYLYTAYERLWHWVMVASVLVLIVTGLHIHFGDKLPFIPFSSAVSIHNLMAAIMLINAVFALFYHLATKEITQFIPAGSGLIKRLIAQARFYMHGIFMGGAHPYPKNRDSKLNPLQQLTYLALLNVLFPAQVITGILLLALGSKEEAIGSMAIIAPIHNLVSWFFITFVVVHVYLITTGHTLTSNLKAMIDGWDIVDGPETGKSNE